MGLYVYWAAYFLSLITFALERTHLQCRRPQFNSWVGKIRWRRDRLPTPVFLGFPRASAGKGSACNMGDLGLTPGLGLSPGEQNGYHFSILLAWRILHGVLGEYGLYSPWGHRVGQDFHFHSSVLRVAWGCFLPAHACESITHA